MVERGAGDVGEEGVISYGIQLGSFPSVDVREESRSRGDNQDVCAR